MNPEETEVLQAYGSMQLGPHCLLQELELTLNDLLHLAWSDAVLLSKASLQGFSVKYPRHGT